MAEGDSVAAETAAVLSHDPKGVDLAPQTGDDEPAEPMEELLAELLAQHTDPLPEALSGMPLETDELLAAAQEPDFAAAFEELLEPEVFEPGSEAGVFELQAEESEVAFAAADSQELLAEATEEEPLPPVEETKPAPGVQALAPQPSLEHVVSSIDEALEQTRAVQVPQEPAPQAPHHKQFSQLDDYVVFTLSGSDYAVPVRDVAEIGRVPAITRLPNVPDFIRGITNLRGEVVPVLNLPALLGLQDVPLSARGRVLFLQGRDRISASGLLVDEVKGIQRIQSQQLEQVTGLVDDKVTSVLRGVHGRGDRLLNVLDLAQLFQLQEFRQLETR